MLNAAMLNAAMLIAAMLNAAVLNAVMLYVVMLNLIMLNFVMLSVSAPRKQAQHNLSLISNLFQKYSFSFFEFEPICFFSKRLHFLSKSVTYTQHYSTLVFVTCTSE